MKTKKEDQDNRRKGMELFSLWLTKTEMQILSKHLEDGYFFLTQKAEIADIIKVAKQRGDYFRQ